MSTSPSHPKPFTKAYLIEECKKLGMACTKWDKPKLLRSYLTGKTVSELQHICKDQGIGSYSAYNKNELIEYIAHVMESAKKSQKKDKHASDADDSPPDGAEKKPRKNSDASKKTPESKVGGDQEKDDVESDDASGGHGNVKVTHARKKGEDDDSDYVDEDPSSDYDENGKKKTHPESRKNKPQKTATTPQKEKTSLHGEEHVTPPKKKPVSHTSPPHKSDKTHHENETHHSTHHSHHHGHGSSHKEKTADHPQNPPPVSVEDDDENDDESEEEGEEDLDEISDQISSVNLSAKTTTTTSTTMKISTKKTKITKKDPTGGVSPKKKKEKITDKIRRSCFKIVFADKLQGKCPVCKFGTVSLDLGQFQAAHILAEAKGGQVTPENLVPSCGCNQIMGTTNLFDYMGKSVEMRKNIWELAYAYWTACIPRAHMEKDLLKYGKKSVLVEFIRTKYGPEEIETYKEWLEIPESFTVFNP